MTIKADVSVKGHLAEVSPRLEVQIKLALLDGAALVRTDARKGAPEDKGTLKNDISVGEVYDERPGVVSVDIGTHSVPYAFAQEFGSGIHREDGNGDYIDIVPVKAAALVFPWPHAPAGLKPDKNGLFYFQHVSHPGVPPHPFLRPALKNNVEAIKALIGKGVLKAVRTT